VFYYGEIIMIRKASEVLADLEARVLKLEKSASTMDFFKSYQRRANEVVMEINKLLPPGIFASRPEKSGKKSRQAKAIFDGFIGTDNSLPVNFDNDRRYKIVFLSDDQFNPQRRLKYMYTQGSFTFFLDGRAVATAKHGEIDDEFLRRIRSALRDR
jgi:hypothetical protein